MRRFLLLTALVVLLVGLVPAMPGLAQPGPQTYTVLVGYENAHTGVGVMSYFPGTVTIHAGDTVHWVINSKEIHTVSFGYDPDKTPLIAPFNIFNYPPPPEGASVLALNPAATTQVSDNGVFTAMANSGLMSLQPDSVHTFDLTFPGVGTYDYLCLVHGKQMSGHVQVVSPDMAIPSPNQSMAMGQQEIAAQLAQVPAVLRAAKQQIQPATPNGDGTVTHHVMIGFHKDMIDVMQFFPDRLVVRPGDTVVWEMSRFNEAPHTVTFLNGAAGPEDFIALPLSNGTVALYLSLQVLDPLQPGQPLTREDIFSSGLLFPVPGTTYSLTIGNMSPGLQPYECLLHDESGMTGTLMVVPRAGRGPLQRFGTNE